MFGVSMMRHGISYFMAWYGIARHGMVSYYMYVFVNFIVENVPICNISEQLISSPFECMHV